MQLRVVCPFTGPGRNRPAGRDDIVRSGGSPASHLKLLHDFRSPRWHTKNRLDNNGKLPETVEKSIAGIRGLPAPGRLSSFLCFQRKLLHNLCYLGLQYIEGGSISHWKASYDNIYGIEPWNDSRPGQFLQAPSKKVPFNNRVSMLGHNHRYPCMQKQGVGCPNIEVFGAYPSPCFFYQLEI